jgi:O-antigen ligase
MAPPMTPSPTTPEGRLARAGWALLAFHLALSPLLFSLHTAGPFEENKAALLTATALALAALAAAARLGGTPLALPSWREPLTAGMLLLTLSAAVSTALSVSPRLSWRGDAPYPAGLRVVLGGLVLYLATRRLCRTSADGRRLLAVAVCAAAAATAYGAAQALGRDPIAWDGGSRLGDGVVRPFSTLGHANLLGAFLAMTAPLAAAFALRAGRARRWAACLAAALLAVAALALAARTLSRSAWAAALVALAALAVGWWRGGARRAALLAAALPLVALLPLALNGGMRAGVAGRLAVLADGNGRPQAWGAAWGLFQERPWCGWGTDAFRLAFGHRRPADWRLLEGHNTPARAHDEPLHVLATQGLLGAAGLALLAFGLARAAARAWRNASPDDRPFVAAVLAAVAACAAQALLGFMTVGVGALFVTCVALLGRWSEAPALASDVSGRGALAGATAAALAVAAALFTLNFGAGHGALVLAVVGCAALVAAALLRAEPPSPRPAPAPARPRAWWRLPAQVGVGVAALAALVVFVGVPLLAARWCRQGDVTLAVSPRGALACYEKAVTLDDGDAASWARLSAAAQAAARAAGAPEERDLLYRQAREALRRACELVPADPALHASRARLLGELVYLDRARPSAAQSAWDAALALDPDNALFLSESARTSIAVGDRQRARRLLTHGLELWPDFAPYHALLGAAAYAECRFAQAEESLKEALLHGDWRGDFEAAAGAQAMLAAVQLARKEYTDALDSATRAELRHPGWATAVFLQAQAVEGMGNPVDAAGRYGRALALDPTYTPAATALRRLNGPAPARP